jgi:predicted methyltransferase
MAKKKRRFFSKSSDGGITYTTDGSFLYAEIGSDVMKLGLFDGHYYKLRPFNGVPILEIDGLRMQLVKDFKTPLDYAKEVVKGLKIPSKGSFHVLDTCMGLGYTAMEAAKKKTVESVITCELSEAVINLAQWNPLGEPLFKDKKIVMMKGNSAEIIKGLEKAAFDFIIHDPPRFSHAGELYSDEFYKELFRVCKKGARIFHYVGSVGKQKGRKIEDEVEKRLKAAGFRSLQYSKRLQGIFALK